MIKYVLMVVGSFLVRLFPLSLSYTLSAAVADLAWLLLRQRRELLGHNYRLVHDERISRRRLRNATRSAFRHLVRNQVDFLRFPRLTAGELRKMASVPGIDHAIEAQRQGRGTIIVTAHLGNWELSGAILASYGLTANVVTESIAPARSLFARDRIGRLLTSYRSSVGLKVIPLESAGLASYRCVRNGESLMLLGDRDISNTGISVPMFGKKVKVPRGPAVLSLKLGTPILTGCLVRDGTGRYHGIIDPPIPFHQDGDFDSDVRKLTALVAGRLEGYIRRFPEQWLIFDRFDAEREDDIPRRKATSGEGMQSHH